MTKSLFGAAIIQPLEKIAIAQTTVPQRKETYSVQKRTAYILILQINSLS